MLQLGDGFSALNSLYLKTVEWFLNSGLDTDLENCQEISNYYVECINDLNSMPNQNV